MRQTINNSFTAISFLLVQARRFPPTLLPNVVYINADYGALTVNGKLISLRTGQVRGLPAVLSNMRLALERKLDLITFGSWPQIRNLVDAYRSKDVPESFSSSRSFLDDHEALAGSAKLLESKITSSSTLRSRFFIHTGSSDSYQWSQGAFIISFQRVSFPFSW